MMMAKKKIAYAALGCMLASVAAGCSTKEQAGTTGGEQAPAAQEKRDPITLKVYQYLGSISDTEFKNLIADPVKKKFPYITMEIVRESATVTKEGLITSGDFPDMVFASSLSLNKALDLELLKDMQDLIKKNSLDLSLYEKRGVDELKAFGDKGQIYALPFSLNFGALFYNRDIFDRAGINPPTDGMTWEGVLNLAKTLAAKEPGVKALGLSGFSRDAQSLRLQPVDPKTHKAAFDSEGWRYWLKYYEDFSQIKDNKAAKGGRDGFVKDKLLAMYTSYGARLGELEEAELSGQGFKWDMASFPVRQDVKDPGMETEVHTLSISTMAKYPEDAFKVIQYLSTNDEVQTLIAKAGRISPLKDEKYKKMFGQDLKSLQGKNVQAIFKNQYGKNAIPTKYDDIAAKAINAASAKVTSGKADINTAIREAVEEANKGIEQAKLAEKK
jgi:multiple sugar transport system substrate-binding protein